MNPFVGYRITSPFGMRMHPVSHKPVFHRGIDLVVPDPHGPLYAFTEGAVTFAKMGSPGIGIPADMGIVVAIKDNKGFLHLYAHLSKALVKVGQQVKQGHMIGNQGTTGVDVHGKPTSTGNHLHYEIRKVASPSNGWTATEAGVVEPTQYLIDYYKEDEIMLRPEDANKIIPFLQAAHNATTDKEARAEAKRLANELRKASGQPTT